MSPEQLEVWRLEELRVEYIKARDVENFRAMYHQDFIGWPSRVTSPVEHSDLGYRIIEAIEKGRELPQIRLRREAVQIFDNIAIVHYASSRSYLSESDDDTIGDKWMKVTHTWMRVGVTWKIIGGMAAPLN
ncbi:MAG: nuclear transport factor 2 family protein [Candidatus Kariarchaeaceae archaeon]